MNPNKHRPFHIYDGCGYFITGRCYERIAYFKTHERKQIFIKTFSRLSGEYQVGIIAWSLLSNHYHCIIRLSQTRTGDNRNILAEFFRHLHSQTASILNQEDQTPGRKVWYQYWDYCIRNKPDFWKHFNYIFQQPLKHGQVWSLSAASDYEYSSNKAWVNRFTPSGMSECLEKYPVRDWTPVNDD